MSEHFRNLTMLEIIHRWPGTVPVIISHRMHCVGCPIAGFHTLGDAIDEHNLSSAELERALAREINLSRERCRLKA